MLVRKSFFFSICGMMLFHILAGEAMAQRVTCFAQFNSIVSRGDNAPFWLISNRQGLPSVEKINGYVRYGMAIEGGLHMSPNWTYSVGLDVVTGYNRVNSVSVQQFYVDLSWKWLVATLGMKHHFGEMRRHAVLSTPDCIKDNTVSSYFTGLYGSTMSDIGTGGLIYSGNSAPIPQLRLEVPEYVDLFHEDSWFKVRGHIAYGMFLDHDFQEDFTDGNRNARYSRNVLYHSKALFVKLEKLEKLPLTIEGGLEMYSQFGGDIYTHGKGKIFSMSRDVRDFLKAFIPGSGDENAPAPEQANMSGNHIGNWHLALTLHTRPVDIRLYAEHMFEDFSQLFFFEYQSNREGKKEVVYYPWRDIQFGISIKNKSGLLKFISNISYEYMSTYDQSGAGYNDPGPYFKEQMDGMDNYYNHSIYPGWHNYGMGIGNPLAVSPVYNTNGSLVFRGNRFKAHHVGVNGLFCKEKSFAYRLMYTYSENWGTYLNPFNEKKYTTSVVADITYTPCKSPWLFSLSLAFDKSDMVGNNLGAMVSVARTNIFN
ncbi:MAG: hypothetical protein IKU76_02920 [Bacteroidaceae bacterium]|nr:hypothetical protein [Bacteroidaceae bacterium]